jgi:hypothetical protein
VTALRILNIITWGVMLVYMLPGGWSATTARARYGDPMRLACALTGFVMLGFNLRALLAPDDETLWKMLLVLSAVLALYILRLGRTYGRGSLLTKREHDDAR